MVNATHLYWPSKARHLGQLARESVRLPVIQVLAAALALAPMSAGDAAHTIRHAVRARVAYQLEPGDRFQRADHVLAARVDDCDGHAVVAAALAAAAGFEARIVGVSLPGESQPGHVRAELSADGRTWWPADSTPTPGDIIVSHHWPAAVVPPDRRRPAPVGYFPVVSELWELGGAVVEGVGDLISAGLDAVGLDDAADWLRAEVREVVRDPRLMAAALGVLGTCVVSPPLCGPAVATAKGLLVAEAVRRYGPDAWASWANDKIASEINDVQARTPRGVWAAGGGEAQKALIAVASGPELAALLGQDPDLAVFADGRTLAPQGLAVVAARARLRDQLTAAAATGFRPRKPTGGLLVGGGLLAGLAALLVRK